jgi:hypothetical protein
MKSEDWQSMETAPLNPYGKPWGPIVLIWDRATQSPVCAYFEPWHDYKDQDCGPAWVVSDGVGDSAIQPEDAAGWMDIAKPSWEKE